jgi:hypothetical protein
MTGNLVFGEGFGKEVLENALERRTSDGFKSGDG